LTRDGDAYCWGQWTNGRMGGGTGPMQGGSIVRFAATEAFTQISADGDRACALTAGGRVYCWGRSAAAPTPVATDVRFTRVSSGWRHACGVAIDSTAYCWGENDSGRLGDGTANPRFDSGDTVLHRVAGEVRFRSIDAGFLSTCAVAMDGRQYCWGDGPVAGAGAAAGAGVTDRCLHAGVSTQCALRPVPTALSSVVAMTSGFTHRCATISDGRAYCWGYNQSHAVSPSDSVRAAAPALVLRAPWDQRGRISVSPLSSTNLRASAAAE
jgi:alpha-tubulin suppressor-like RCC1 family protein